MRRHLALIGTFLIALSLVGVVALAQKAGVKPPAALAAALAGRQPPALTETQRLQIQNGVQHLELVQARMQILQADFEQTRKALADLLASLRVEGYDLDLQTMAYVKKVPAK